MIKFETWSGHSGDQHLVIRHPRPSGNGYAYSIYTKTDRNAKAAARDCGAETDGTTNEMWDRLFKERGVK